MGQLLILLVGVNISLPILSKKNMEHIKEKYYGGHDAAAEAFEELCAMVENINAEREEARERGQLRCQMLRGRLARQKEKLHNLREKYGVLLDMYNAEKEEQKERSDSSSSDDSDGEGDCCIM